MINQSVVTVGCFDGIHLGHREVINCALDNSKSRSICLVTFNRNPKLFFSDKKFDFYISNSEQRDIILKESFDGFIKVVDLDFSEDFSKIPGEKFVKDIIARDLRASLIVVGQDFRFGDNCSCDINCLKLLGEKYKFQVKVVDDLFDKNGVKYSSSNVRNLIRCGKVSEAKKHLGYYWQVQGMVLHGKKIGLKYATANVSIGSYVWPKFGVYAVKVILEDKRVLCGVANFGICSTFMGKIRGDLLPEDVSLEVHILNGFSEDIYDQVIKVDFIDFIRKEEKFDSRFLLESKIDEDCKIASYILEKLV